MSHYAECASSCLCKAKEDEMREKFYVALANIGGLMARTKAGELVARLLMKISKFITLHFCFKMVL